MFDPLAEEFGLWPDAARWSPDRQTQVSRSPERFRPEHSNRGPDGLLRFTTDGLQGLCSWVCAGFDPPPVQGWVEPIVSRESLEEMTTFGLGWAIEDCWDRVRLIPKDVEWECAELFPDADGLFHLADLGWVFLPLDVGGLFFLDAHPATAWRAEGFERRWGGWAKPIVTHAVLIEVLMNSFAQFVDAAGVVKVIDPRDETATVALRPGADGLYAIRELGWGFETARP